MSENIFQRNKMYYWGGGLTTIAVKEQLFKLPRHQFVKHSETFRTLFQLPQGTQKETQEGTSDENPIHLPLPADVSVDGFVAFLKLLYPAAGFRVDEPSTIEDWSAILRLSTVWLFDNIRAAALPKVDSFLNDTNDASARRSIENITLGRSYQIKDWLIQGYCLLTCQEASLTNEDIKMLGWETAADIFRLREKHNPSYPVPKPKSQCPCRCGDWEDHVRRGGGTAQYQVQFYCGYQGGWYTLTKHTSPVKNTDIKSAIEVVLVEELGGMQTLQEAIISCNSNAACRSNDQE